jgi:5'-nucleotidase / UDP-sugar diphosphatase
MPRLRLSLLFFLFAAAPPAQAFRFTVLHTNDLHSQFEGNGPDSLFSAAKGDGDPIAGHYARLATVIRQIRRQKEKEGEPVLLFDAGDFYSGSLFHGLAPREDSSFAPELEFFHRLGYDGVTFGNHELDAGEAGLETALRKAKAQWGLQNLVLTNRAAAEGLLSEVPEAIVKEIGSGPSKLRVGVLGFMGPDAARVANRTKLRLVGFDDDKAKERLSDLIALAEERAARLRRERGVGLVIALIHGGSPEDEALGKAKGIDLVISGHAHELYETPRRAGSAWVAQAGSFGRYLGVLELNKTEKGLELRNPGSTYRKMDDLVEADSGLLGRIEVYKKEIERLLKDSGLRYDTKVTTLTKSLERNDDSADGPGRTLTTALREEVNRVTDIPVDVYFTSRSLIRSDLRAVGAMPTPQQFSDLFRVLAIGFGEDMSLGSPVVSATFSKADFLKLLHLLEVYRWITPHFALFFSDSVTYRRDPKGLPFVSRLTDIRLHGKPMSEVGPWIRLATNAFAASFFPKLGTMSRGLVHLQLRDPRGNPVDGFRKEPVPSEPFLFARSLRRQKR